MPLTKVTRKAISRITAATGRGLFALDLISKGESIAVWAGKIVKEHELKNFSADQHSNCVQIGIDTFLVPTMLTAGDYINHSCLPNAGLRGLSTLVAMRDINTGEEITYDYAMTDTSCYDEFQCACGNLQCRGKITGNDWKLPELQERYKGYFSEYVTEIIMSIK